MNVKITSFKTQQGDTRYQLVIGYTSVILSPMDIQQLCTATCNAGFTPDLPSDPK